MVSHNKVLSARCWWYGTSLVSAESQYSVNCVGNRCGSHGICLDKATPTVVHLNDNTCECDSCFELKSTARVVACQLPSTMLIPCSRTSLSSRKLSSTSVMCSACRVSSVTAVCRRKICKTTSSAIPREHFAIKAIRLQRISSTDSQYHLSRRYCTQQSAARRGAQVANSIWRSVRGGTREVDGPNTDVGFHAGTGLVRHAGWSVHFFVNQEARGARRQHRRHVLRSLKLSTVRSCRSNSFGAVRVIHGTTVSAGIWAVWSRVEQSDQTTWITKTSGMSHLSKCKMRCTSFRGSANREEHGVTVAYILNDLCADKQHYTVIVASEHTEVWSTGALEADTGHIKAHWRAHEGPGRLARRSAVLGAVADQQLQRSTWRSQKPSAARSLVLWQASMNRLPWICATRKNVLEMSGRINGPATGGQTPCRSDWRRHAQSTHACKRRTPTSGRGEASCGDAGARAADGGAAQRWSVVHRARQGACGDETTACRVADPLRWGVSSVVKTTPQMTRFRDVQQTIIMAAIWELATIKKVGLQHEEHLELRMRGDREGWDVGHKWQRDNQDQHNAQETRHLTSECARSLLVSSCWSQPNPSPNSFMQQSGRNASRTRSPKIKSQCGWMSRWPCKDYFQGTCTNSFCEMWDPPECFFYMSDNGCRFGKKCSYAHRQVDEQPSKRSQKNGDRKCSGYVDHYTTIGLHISRYGAAAVFIDFSEELKHTETNPMCSIH